MTRAWYALNALNVVDALATTGILYIGGRGLEFNPVVAAVIAAGFLPFFTGKIALVFIFSTFLRLLEMRRTLFALAGAYATLVTFELVTLVHWAVRA